MFWPQHDLLTQEIKKKLYRLTLVGATTLVFSLAPGPTPKYPDSRKPLQQNPLALDRRSPFSLRQLAWVSSWQLSLRLILNTMSLTSKKQTNQKSRNLQLPYLVCVCESVCVCHMSVENLDKLATQLQKTEQRVVVTEWQYIHYQSHDAGTNHRGGHRITWPTEETWLSKT